MGSLGIAILHRWRRDFPFSAKGHLLLGDLISGRAQSTTIRISQTTRLDRVQHILGSGSVILDFAVEGESGYYTWDGTEDSNWEVEDVDRVENVEEDRFIMYPEGKFFVCEIESKGEEGMPDRSGVGVNRRLCGPFESIDKGNEPSMSCPSSHRAHSHRSAAASLDT